jgi:hypothetical protein
MVVVSLADKIKMIERLDAKDFNVKDIEELKRIFREDIKYWAQHPFWGAVFGKLVDYTECYCIMKNARGGK